MALEARADSPGRLDESMIQRFRAGLRGALLGPGDAGYGEARRVFNAMIDRHPALILRCAGVADVRRGVEFAATHALPLSIRGGGHGVAGNAVCDGGLMLDLRRMKGMRVDPARRVGQGEPGLLLGEFDHETAAFGLATPFGVVSVTGIAGLTLGGGLGWLNGKYGLSCDNLLAADVVTADGALRTASAEQNADLLWGLRGGGGNFGVVTSFTYQLHPVDTVLAGGLSYAAPEARDALRFYHEFASASPDELSTAASVGRTPEGEPVVSIAVCWCGALEAGERVLAPLRAFGAPIGGEVAPLPYQVFQCGSDAGFPLGRQHYWKSSYLKDLSDGAIEVLLEFAAKMPSPVSGIGFQQMCGAASRVEPAATAFPHRDQHYDFLILSQWTDPAESDANIAWTRALFDAMQPFLKQGVYVNNLGDEGADRVRAAYGANYERLAALKAKYDPGNLLRLNQNVKATA